MIKIRQFAWALIAASALTAPTFAADPDECHALIDVVRQTLAATDIGGGNPDRTRDGLDSKLDGADTKIDEAKACDAYQKLVDFRNKIEAMAVPNRKGETKIDPAAAAQLLSEVDDAIDCVLELDPSCAG